MSNWPGLVSKDDPDWNDPRFQKKIVSFRRVVEIIENIHEVTLECGHEPLLLGDDPKPEVGMMAFCGDCRDQAASVTKDTNKK